MKYSIDKKDYGINVKLYDSFTFRDHDVFFEIIQYIKTNKPKVVVVNMIDCDFVDSAALGMLVILSDEMSFIYGKAVLVNLKGMVKDIVYAARFDMLFKIANSDKILTDTKIEQFVEKTFK